MSKRLCLPTWYIACHSISMLNRWWLRLGHPAPPVWLCLVLQPTLFSKTRINIIPPPPITGTVLIAFPIMHRSHTHFSTLMYLQVTAPFHHHRHYQLCTLSHPSTWLTQSTYSIMMRCMSGSLLHHQSGGWREQRRMCVLLLGNNKSWPSVEGINGSVSTLKHPFSFPIFMKETRIHCGL